MTKKILVADDEKNILDIIVFNLEKEGYITVSAKDGEEALELALSEKPDIVLLDIMMPKLDGYSVCRKIREKSNVPIIMLTARADEVDKVFGLDLGADDYITKPFSMRELLSRVKANLRRNSEYSSEKTEEENMMTYRDLIIDMNRYEVRRGKEIIELTVREFELLKFLIMNKGQVCTRETLLEQVWEYEYYGDMRTVDVNVHRLRDKLMNNSDQEYIITRRGIGYMMSKE